MSTTPEVTDASVTSSGGQKDERKETADTTPDLRDGKSDEETSATKTDGQEDERKETADTTPDLRDRYSEEETPANKNKPIMNQSRETDLLLVGKTGNGKSATGNSILRLKGRKPFKSSANSTSVTQVVSAEVTEYNGRKIKVVDGPGVGDTREDGLDIVLKGLQNAILLNDRGYHAFLLVVRFGGRFTVEDSKAVELLKGYFGGPTFLKNYCILVLTCGDNFENESEDSGQTFKEWCNSQGGVLKELINECKERVILFDNQTKDKAKQSKQLDELLETVDLLPTQGRRYCDEQFELAKEGREKAMVNLQKPYIDQEIMEKTSMIIEKLNRIGTTDDTERDQGPLNEMKKEVDTLYESIKSQDKETGALQNIIETVEGLRRAVYSRAEICEVMTTMGKKFDAERQKSKKEIEEFKALARSQQDKLRDFEMKLKKALANYQTCKTTNEKTIEELSKRVNELNDRTSSLAKRKKCAIL